MITGLIAFSYKGNANNKTKKKKKTKSKFQMWMFKTRPFYWAYVAVNVFSVLGIPVTPYSASHKMCVWVLGAKTVV